MRRLGALLLSRLGRIPEQVQDADYRSQTLAPASLIRDGRYVPGWFDRAPERLNLGDSTAPWLARQAWLYLHFDTPDHFVVASLASLGVADNLALVVVDKHTGRFREGGTTKVGPRRGFRVGRRGERIDDPASGSFICMKPSGEVEFSVHARELHLVGRAVPRFSRQFVQSTRYHGGHGTLQWWGALMLEQAVLSTPEAVIPVPAGSLGIVDRTLGHRPSLQAWNWLAAAGTTEAGLPYGLQLACDRPEARPRVDHGKAVAWVGDRLFKIADLSFERGSTWTIRGQDLELEVQPQFSHRESRDRVVYRAEFCQHYGTLEGRLGEHRLSGDFAVLEDSLLQL